MNLPTHIPTREELTKQAKEPGFWKEVWNQIRLIGYLVKDPEVPFYLKLLPAAAILYLLMPVDFIPDILLGIGQLDDLTAMFVASKVFISLSPQHIVAHYQERLRSQFVEDKVAEIAATRDKTLIIDSDDLEP